jgi:rRNA processing protein Krr1/Pno1
MNKYDDTFEKSLIGKTKEEAQEICEKAGYECRLTQEDESIYVITMDLRSDRINIVVKNNIVIEANKY